MVVRPSAGGIQRHVDQLIAGLNSRGYRIGIASPSAIGSETVRAVTTFHQIPIGARSRPIADLHCALQVAKVASSHDMLHGHGLRGGWIASLASRFSGKPYILTAHNLAPAVSGLSAALLRKMIANSSQVICVSNAVAETLTPYGLTANKRTVIPNGIDVDEFDEDANRAGDSLQFERPFVCAVGRLSPEKGFDLLVEAAAKCEGLQFVLAGAGSEEQNLRDCIRGHGLADRFMMVGRVENIAALMSASELVAIPSKSEGQGIAALEAMAAAKPVVAFRVGGLIETVVDGETGLLVEPENPASMAEGILKLMGDEVLRVRFGAAGRILVEQKYELSAMIDRSDKVYGQALQRQ